MVLEYLDPTPQYRLQQICTTLKNLHGVDISHQLSDTDNLEEHFNNYTRQRDKLIEASSFNSYAHNPQYIASMLILEAFRIQLREVAPRRRKQSVKEAQNSPMARKDQQRLEFARKLEQFATHTSPPSKTGKLSSDEKAMQDQKDLFVVALQNIAEKLQHQGTAFARPEENKLTALEVNIAKLMRHAEAAGILDSLDPRKMDMVVNKGVEMYGDQLLAARGEHTAPYAKTDKTIDEIKAEDPEAERAKAEFFKRGGRVTQGPSKVARGSEKHRRSWQGGHGTRTGTAQAFSPLGGMGRKLAENKNKKPDADGDGIPDWADKHPKKAGGKEDRKMNEAELSPKQRKMAALGGNKNRIDAADLAALRHGATMDEDDMMFGMDDGMGMDMHNPADDAHQDPEMHNDIKDIAQVKGVDIHHSDIHKDDVKHYEYQASMARSELYRNAKYAMAMLHQVKPDEEIQPWIAGALTKAANYLDKIYHYLDYYKTFEPDQLPEDMDMDMELGETSGSIARQNLMMICEYSTKLFDMIKPGDHLEGWVAMKLTTASECISSSKHYLEYVQFEHNGLDDHFDDARRANRKVMAEGALKSQKKRRRRLAEQQDLEQAETLLAAKDLSDQLQQTAEKLAKMGVEDLMPLVDVMRQQFGPEAATGFNDTVKAALDGLLDSTTQTKEQVDQSIETLQGGGVPAQAGTPEVTGAADELAGGDELAGAPADMGAEEPAAPEEPLGRSKKEPMAEAQSDYMKRRAQEKKADAGKPVKPQPKNAKTDYEKKRAEQKKAGLDEARYYDDQARRDNDAMQKRDDDASAINLNDPVNKKLWGQYMHYTVGDYKNEFPGLTDYGMEGLVDAAIHSQYDLETRKGFLLSIRHIKGITEARKKCMECGKGWYMEASNGKMKCNKCGKTVVAEAWDTKMHTAKKDVGKWEGWTEAELNAKRAKLMKKETRTAAEQKEVKQIDFALRAKGTKGKKWGKVDESQLQENSFATAMKKAIAADSQGNEKSKQHYLDVAKTARYALKSAEMVRHKDLLDKYKEMTSKVSEDLAPGQTDPYSNMSDSKLQQLANSGDATAKTLWTQRQSGGQQSSQPVQETAPPGEAAERFIRKNKASFQKRYGDRGEEVLYATAWKKFGKKSESQVNAEMQLESVQAMINNLNDQLAVYKAEFRGQLQEGRVVDPLNTGYGLDGEIVMGKIQACQNKQRKLQQIIETQQQNGIKKIQEQVAAVVEIRNLQSQLNTRPWGVVYRDHTGKQQQKFFESAANRQLWHGLNKNDIKVIRSVGPRDFQAKINKLKKI